jgi:histidine triad (HIT) family protein
MPAAYDAVMASIFSRIIGGEIPGRFVWRDDQAVAFLDVRPLSPGHTLVVPITEVDQWTDLEPELAAHLVGISHAVGVAQRGVFAPERIGLVIAGFEVPHVHVHVFPAASMAVFDFGTQLGLIVGIWVARSLLGCLGGRRQRHSEPVELDDDLRLPRLVDDARRLGRFADHTHDRSVEGYSATTAPR